MVLDIPLSFGQTTYFEAIKLNLSIHGFEILLTMILELTTQLEDGEILCLFGFV